MSMTKGAAPRRHVRGSDEDRVEQAAALGHTAEFAAELLGLPVEFVDEVWSEMDKIHAEAPTRPAAATAYGRQS